MDNKQFGFTHYNNMFNVPNSSGYMPFCGYMNNNNNTNLINMNNTIKQDSDSGQFLNTNSLKINKNDEIKDKLFEIESTKNKKKCISEYITNHNKVSRFIKIYNLLLS